MSNINKQYLKELVKCSKQGREANCIAAEDALNTYVLRHRTTVIAIISVNDNDPELLFDVDAYGDYDCKDRLEFKSTTPAQFIYDLLNISYSFLDDTIFDVKALLLEALRKLGDADQLAEYDALIEDYRIYFNALTGEDGLSRFTFRNPVVTFYDNLFKHYGQYSAGVDITSTHVSDGDKVINIKVAGKRFITITLTAVTGTPHVMVGYVDEEISYNVEDVYSLVNVLHYKTLEASNSSILLKPIFSFLGKGLYDYRQQNPTDDIFTRIQDILNKAYCVNTQILGPDELPF